MALPLQPFESLGVAAVGVAGRWYAAAPSVLGPEVAGAGVWHTVVVGIPIAFSAVTRLNRAFLERACGDSPTDAHGQIPRTRRETGPETIGESSRPSHRLWSATWIPSCYPSVICRGTRQGIPDLPAGAGIETFVTSRESQQRAP